MTVCQSIFYLTFQCSLERSVQSKRSTSSTSSSQSLWVDIESKTPPHYANYLSNASTSTNDAKRPLSNTAQIHVEPGGDLILNGKVPKLIATTTLGPIDNSSLLQPLDQNKVIPKCLLSFFHLHIF